MTVYVVAQLKFTDLPAYRRYQQAFAAVFARFNGQMLAADEQPQVIEGDWPMDKLVLMSFPDKDSARSFVEDPAYQDISRDRRAGAQTVALIVRGLG
jgi:uncharacterized protein (DUF1330 family)